MTRDELLLGKLLIWVETRRGRIFSYFDIEREFCSPRETTVAIVQRAVEMGSIEHFGEGRWKHRPRS